MARSAAEIFNDKVSLIYEYEKSSPLFVRKANTEIDNNNLEKAIEILNAGLKLYPNYTVAYLVLSKAYTLIGNYSQALKMIRTGSELIPSKKTYDFYLKEIENIRRQRSLFETTRRNAFLSSDEEYNEADQPDLFEENTVESSAAGDTQSVDERLEDLAREISSAKISESVPESNMGEYSASNYSGGNMIISETLAKIYITQGEYQEAVEVYKKLITKNPDKKEYYEQKINEIISEAE